MDLHEEWHRLVLSYRGSLWASLLVEELCIDDVVQGAVLFEELLVVQEVIAREDSAKEASSAVLVVCFFDGLPLFFGKGIWVELDIGTYIACYLQVDFLDLLVC